MNPREPALDEKVVAIESAFRRTPIAHAFGGALALAYYAEPRATVDIDVNVFVPPSDFEHIATVLVRLGVTVDSVARSVAPRDGQVRVWWSRTPVDLFFAYDEFHTRAATRVRRAPFGDATITILAPADLLVCKAVFDRRKDWIDIEQMLVMTVGELDVDGVHSELARIVGNDDERVARFDRAVTEVLGGSSTEA